MIRTIQLVTQLEPAGAQTMARWLQSVLAELGPTETVFLYDKSGSELFPAPSLVVRNRPRTPGQAIELVRRLRRLRRRWPDVALAHTHYSIVIAGLLWGRGPTRIVAVHHWPIDRYPASARLLIGVGRRRGWFDEEVFVSPAVVDRPGARVIPNPVPDAGPYRERDDVPADIVVVARHATEKSLDTAVDAMKLLPGRTLTLVGGGPLTDRLVTQVGRAGLADRVVFAGRLTNPEVRSLMRRSSVFLLPSLWEAMPVSLLEAVAEGAVIVASDIPAHRFLLDPGAAIGFSPGDAVSLAEALRAGDDERTRHEVLAAADRVRGELDSARIATAWQQTVGELVPEGSSAG